MRAGAAVLQLPGPLEDRRLAVPLALGAATDAEARGKGRGGRRGKGKGKVPLSEITSVGDFEIRITGNKAALKKAKLKVILEQPTGGETVSID